MVKQFYVTEKGLVFVDIVPLMLGSDGKPNPELFVKDGLHTSEKGYDLWNAEVKKGLMK